MRRLVALVALVAAAASQAAAWKATLLLPVDDLRLTRSRVERDYLGHAGGPASDGLAVALGKSKLELDAAGATLEIETVAVASTAAAREAAVRADKAGQVAVLADLPGDQLLAVADATSLPVLNLGDAADRLREADCRPRLYHLLQSERMCADALTQTLVARKWRDVLPLVGPGAADAESGAAVRAAIGRYGLKLVAAKSFKLSGDPRERDLANPLLLTAATGGAYDAVWVVDTDGDFARSLPYRTALPRPVVGDAGLLTLAWAPGFDRFGAPQVGRRFAKAARRPMTGHDWAAWMAGKALAAAVSAKPRGPIAALRQVFCLAAAARKPRMTSRRHRRVR